MDRVALIREHVPDCAITTDIIVGFPGETEADFEQTLEVVDEVGYDGAFTFIFSPRRGTEAASFEDQLSHATKRERMERLVELVQRRARERAERFVGRTMEVLVEGPSRTDASRLRGRTRHNKTVNFDGTAAPGETVEVEITGATSTDALRAGATAQPRGLRVLALFGPTAVGKTGVAIAVAERLRERGEDPVAVNCDSIQVYRGLETLSGAATARSGSSSSTGCSPSSSPARSSAPAAMRRPHTREIDALLAEGRRPIVVGGTGLYLRAALADLDLRPPVPRGDSRRGRGRARRARPGGAARGARSGPRGERRPERPQAGGAADRAGAGGDRGCERRRGDVDRRAPAPDPAGRPHDGPGAPRGANRRPGRRDDRRGGGRGGAERPRGGAIAHGSRGTRLRAARLGHRRGSVAGGDRVDQGGASLLRPAPAHLDAPHGGGHADRSRAGRGPTDDVGRSRGPRGASSSRARAE